MTDTNWVSSFKKSNCLFLLVLVVVQLIAITESKRYHSIAASMVMASWNNVAGWKQNAHMFHVDRICDSLDRFMPGVYHSFLRSIYGELRSCPIEPGIFRLQNWTLSWNDIPVKHFFYGRWRADVSIVYPNKEIAGCVRGEAETHPK